MRNLYANLRYALSLDTFHVMLEELGVVYEIPAMLQHQPQLISIKRRGHVVRVRRIIELGRREPRDRKSR